MSNLLFDKSLVLILGDLSDTALVEKKLASTMCVQGYVKDTYARAIAEREKEFPTALEVGDINVAIPHCDTEHVNISAVCVGILKTAVPWRRMDDPDSTSDVRLVFMLALSEAHAHLEMIQKIIGIIQDQQFAKKLVESNAEQAYELLKPRLS